MIFEKFPSLRKSFKKIPDAYMCIFIQIYATYVFIKIRFHMFAILYISYKYGKSVRRILKMEVRDFFSE